MKHFILLALLSLGFTLSGWSQKISLEEYISEWKDVAMNQMLSHGIPASITLSQGILESGFGNSELAQNANNHFGIKCHGWKGKTYLKDDDKRDECFRKYKNAAQSFEDHSEFLTSRSRYASLFELEITDYKSWAKGLKAAGYATNPKYPRRLIDIIEKYNLDQYDVLATSDWIAEQSNEKKENTPSGAEIKQRPDTKPAQNAGITIEHKVYKNQNKTKYVVAGKHDTFYLIAKEFGFSLRQLDRWNDFPPQQDFLKEGDKVYIMRKRKRIRSEKVHQELKRNANLWEIAQEFGVQMSALEKLKTNLEPAVLTQQ